MCFHLLCHDVDIIVLSLIRWSLDVNKLHNVLVLQEFYVK